jgi:Intracellular proteinase inhibitor
MTDRISSLTRRVLTTATAALSIACGDSTAPVDAGTDAALAAKTFSQLADSVARAGGDADVGNAYSGIAGILRTGGNVTPIALTIDGVAKTFLATAMTMETTVNDCPPGAQCVAPPKTYSLRNLIAWEKDNPTRLVQLSSSTNDEKIGAIFDPSPLALYVRMASLVYMDGAGGTFIGTSGSQKFDVSKSASPCPAGAESDSTLRILRLDGTCTLADHSVSFSGSAEPSPFIVTSNTAKGTHTIAMSAQTVHGTFRTMTITPCAPSCYTPEDSLAHPPVVVRPSNQLPATLSATLNGDVTLTFTVKNPTSAAVKVVYPSAQKYNLWASDSATGKSVWTWSADKLFGQAVSEDVVPAGGSLTFVEKWTPPKSGLYLVRAALTSSSHRSQAYASVVAP